MLAITIITYYSYIINQALIDIVGHLNFYNMFCYLNVSMFGSSPLPSSILPLFHLQFRVI